MVRWAGPVHTKFDSRWAKRSIVEMCRPEVVEIRDGRESGLWAREERDGVGGRAY